MTRKSAITDYFEEIPGIKFDFHPNLTLAFTHKFIPG